MNCPICNRPVAKKGCCTDCFPFNMYFGFFVTAAGLEVCRLLMLKHKATLASIPFTQAKVEKDSIGRSIPAPADAQVEAVTDGDFVMVPALDAKGRKSVIFARKP